MNSMTFQNLWFESLPIFWRVLTGKYRNLGKSIMHTSKEKTLVKTDRQKEQKCVYVNKNHASPNSSKCNTKEHNFM